VAPEHEPAGEDESGNGKGMAIVAVVIALICLAQMIAFGYGAVLQIRAAWGGVPGVLEVEECQDLGSVSPRWDCKGRFVSDDGTLTIDNVEIADLHDRPVETIDVRLPDRHSTTAFEDASPTIRVLTGGFFSCVLLVMAGAVIGLGVYGVWRWRRRMPSGTS